MATLQSRLALPEVAGFTAEQRAIHDSVMATRGSLNGPFLAWMHSPRLASLAEKLGAFCRYDTQLALLESELLILCVASHFQCVGERQLHEPIAREAGMSDAEIGAVREGCDPEFSDSRLRMLHRLATVLLSTNRIPTQDYHEAEALFGTTQLVEIVGIIGYYALVAMTLNAFDMRLAESSAAPARPSPR